MKTFAILINPTTTQELKRLLPVTRFLPNSALGFLLRKNLSFKVLTLKKIRSREGKEVSGHIIVWPVLKQTIDSLDKETIKTKIIEAGLLAGRLGARIMGTNGSYGLSAQDLTTIAQKIKIPFTSGESLLSWSFFESIFLRAQEKKLQLNHASIAIIGAASSLGMLCAKKLASYASNIILADTDEEKLKTLKEILVLQNTEEHKQGSIESISMDELPEKAAQADIFILVSNTACEKFARIRLKPKSIICAVPDCQNLDTLAALLKDSTVIKGGMIKLPASIDLGIDLGLPDNLIHAAFAEPILLAFEERTGNFSLGGATNINRLEDIADIAVGYGFEVCDLIQQAHIR
ncbi:MAG: hypothetical protein WDL87_05745 [Candidatus Omnitrophota bacterium]|jgi:predicted amino acid dehydrogenase